MTKHTDATRTGNEPGARARRAVSERIYDYIRTGRPTEQDQRGTAHHRPAAAPRPPLHIPGSPS